MRRRRGIRSPSARSMCLSRRLSMCPNRYGPPFRPRRLIGCQPLTCTPGLSTMVALTDTGLFTVQPDPVAGSLASEIVKVFTSL
jgi:hypothetical protein